ncbi:BTB/POZ domain-containing protein 1 [Desmophyllum pertusum]|uniref:BTB/POZ domain-containing protein 1 n=1 Tax=Desmophyllum pertusum TaxID=174260 RepID=A0A9X0D597_9CNID|nr:BTB/POZ domain-containing protein 1 [Desmophyllum pertusum]
MDPLDALNVIQHAIHLKEHGLERCCWEVIDYNAQKIVADDSFLELNREFLLLFLERSSLRIDEATLFEAVDRWAARKCEEASMTVDGANKRWVLGKDLLKLVRFSLMSPKGFRTWCYQRKSCLQLKLLMFLNSLLLSISLVDSSSQFFPG